MDNVTEAIRGLPTTVIHPAGDVWLILSSKQFRMLFQCSSERLIQNCGHFQKKLAAGEQPHIELVRDGKVYLTIHNFDPSAIEIILNLIHGRIRNIPGSPSFSLLYDLARFCHYLECVPAIQPFATSWIDKIKHVVMGLTTLKSDTMQWIFIPYVFRHEDLFRHMTALAQQLSTENLERRRDRDQVPVPKDVITTINNARHAYLYNLSSLLYQRLSRLSGGPAVCGTKCDRLYQDLVIKISKTGLIPIFKRPDRHCKGYVPNTIRNTLLGVSSEKLHLRCPHGREAECPNWQNPLGQDVEDHLWAFSKHLAGLDLPDQG